MSEQHSQACRRMLMLRGEETERFPHQPLTRNLLFPPAANRTLLRNIKLEPVDFLIRPILQKHRLYFQKLFTIHTPGIRYEHRKGNTNSPPGQWLGVHHVFSLDCLFGLTDHKNIELDMGSC